MRTGLVDATSARTDDPVSSVPPGARLNRETAGRIGDRMSIMALKVHVMRAQTERGDVDTSPAGQQPGQAGAAAEDSKGKVPHDRVKRRCVFQ